MAEVEQTSMGHERAPEGGWDKRPPISDSIRRVLEMGQGLLEDVIAANANIDVERITVEILPPFVSVRVSDMTGKESARIVPLLQRYAPETFGWETVSMSGPVG